MRANRVKNCSYQDSDWPKTLFFLGWKVFVGEIELVTCYELFLEKSSNCQEKTTVMSNERTFFCDFFSQNFALKECPFRWLFECWKYAWTSKAMQKARRPQEILALERGRVRTASKKSKTQISQLHVNQAILLIPPQSIFPYFAYSVEAALVP